MIVKSESIVPKDFMEKFRSLGLSESSISALKVRGFEEPTEIQQKIIPILLQKKTDIIAQAQTGTGKTAAFGLVFAERLKPREKFTQAIVMVPTRELAIQVAEEISSLKGDKNLRIIPIYGGQSMTLQLKQLRDGADIIIGTPGRILDHLSRKSIQLKQVKYIVLDEADEMLNMGFIEDIEEILNHSNEDSSLLLFSATMPDRIKSLAKEYMNEFLHIQAEKNQISADAIDQIYFEVRESDKFEALCRIIDVEKKFYGIVFCRTKVDVDAVSKHLSDRGYNAEALHGDIAQNQREKILGNFKSKKTMIMVATDVASRGIDVNNLTHVINYSLPQDPEAYVHRIGRTGRAGNEGTAITFVTKKEYRQLSFIQRIARTEIRKEKLPDAKDVLQIKKEKIKSEIEEIIENEDLNKYKDLTKTFFSNMDKDTVIAALLKHSFGTELEAKTYDIRDDGDSRGGNLVDTTGMTRLFITLGTKDGMNAAKLVKAIEKETGVPQNMMNNVEIFNIFSFVTVPFKEAEIILHKFRHGKKESGFTVEKASDQKKKSSSSSSSSYDRNKKRKRY